MTTTRVLAYGIDGSGGTGALLAAGTLVAPFVVLFHPDLGQPTEEAMWGPLRSAVLAAPMGSVRIRLLITGAAGPEVVDGRVFHTAEASPEWLAAAVLERTSHAPFSGLPAATGRGGSYRSRFRRQFELNPVTISAADRARKAPARPKKTTTSPSPAGPAGGPDGRPTFWPIDAAFPVVDELVEVVLQAFSCKRWPCFLWCPCPQ